MSGAASGPLVVVGDALLDVDLSGTAERLCPDAPAPVVELTGRRVRPGGAALAALLAARWSDRPVVLVTALAADEAGALLAELVTPHLRLVRLPARGTTPVKTRVRVGDCSLVRLDSGTGAAPAGDLPAVARQALAAAAGLLVADYGQGSTAHEPVRAAVRAARCPVVWDPHPRGRPPVEGTRLVTPNAAEARALAGAAPRPASEASEARHLAALGQLARTLAARWQVGAVSVTSGAAGAALAYGTGAPLLVPADPVAARDTCGAGDAFAAAAALGLADGALVSEAVRAAVPAASQFVAAGGASALGADGTASPPAVLRSDAGPLQAPRRPVVVATGGCFDVLHAGHVATLTGARRLGDRLVVCVNSDASVRRLKGPGRPVVPVADRVRLLAALECVDEVVVFEEDTPAAVLDHVRPDIWVKGGDYAGAELPEAAVVARWGGHAVVLPYLAGRSTTAIVERAAGPRAAVEAAGRTAEATGRGGV